MHNTNLILMNDSQKEAALSVIKKKAKSVIDKSILTMAIVWIFIYVILYLENSKASDVAPNITLATFVTVIVGVSFVERIINNIVILNKVKRLLKNCKL